MKLQLTSLITLAILCGSVTATPIKADDAPSTTDDTLSNDEIAALWNQLVPNASLQASVARDVQDEDQSIADALFDTAGNAIGGLWRGIVPNSALQGSARGAGACIQQNGQVFCPQRRDLEEEDQSIADSIFNTAGNALGGLFSGIVPNTALQGAARGAGACIVRNGRLLCPQRRDLEEEDQSIADSLFNTAGQAIGALWGGIVPNSALRGSAQGAGACIVQNGQLLCPQRRDLEEEDQSIADSIFGTAGNLIGGLWGNIVPNSALQGSARGAGACIVRNGQLLCPSS